MEKRHYTVIIENVYGKWNFPANAIPWKLQDRYCWKNTTKTAGTWDCSPGKTCCHMTGTACPIPKAESSTTKLN